MQQLILKLSAAGSDWFIKVFECDSSLQTQRTDEETEEQNRKLFFYTDLVQTAESCRVLKFMRRN